MRRSVQNELTDDVEVPHGVHTRHESGAMLESNLVVAPFPVTFAVLTNDEEGDGGGGTEESHHDHELEPEDESLNKRTVPC